MNVTLEQRRSQQNNSAPRLSWSRAGLIALFAVAAVGLWFGPLGRAADESPPPAAASTETEPPPANDNPYLAPPELTWKELVRYLDKMQAKPDTIRAREGFVEALLDAAERILADAGADAVAKRVAQLARFDCLHHVARRGDTTADARLAKYAEELKNADDADVAAAARFYHLEQRTLAATTLDPAQLTALLGELKEYFTRESLTDRQLRLASASVRAMNRIEDLTERNRAFEEFGNLFAKSKDRKLARYGKEIAKSQAGGGDLVGQMMEVSGTAVDGTPLDWSTYAGKVVLVDFWATWCGPCVAEMPNVRAAYDKYHDRGFEVVGVSLDQDRGALLAFIDEHKLPWVNLFDESGENPLATKYGVSAIPFPVLVGRDGKVVSTAARGPDLEQLLEKLLKE